MFTREEVDGLLKEPKYTDNDLVDLRRVRLFWNDERWLMMPAWGAA